MTYRLNSTVNKLSIVALAVSALTPPAYSANQIEEVIVTAEKRSENLQVVPIAVTAFSERELEEMQAWDVSDLANRAPGLMFQQGTTKTQELSIRGIGTIGEFGASVDPSVATFIDEVYVGRMGVATMDFFDIERIEVLRGPQGTLFGKNVVGGAISIHTARPEHEASGRVRVGYGNYQSSLISGHITGPITDNVAGRLSAHLRDRSEGYGYNAYRDEEIETLSAYALRGQLLFDSWENLEILVRADMSHDEGDGKGRRAIDDPFIPGQGPVSSWYPDNDVRKIYNVNEQGHDRDVWGVSAEINWDVGFGSVTSVTGYRDANAETVLDQFSAPRPPALAASYLIFDESYEAFSQELRFSSNPGERLDWIAGLYYLTENTISDDDNFSGEFWLDQPSVNYHYLNDNETNNYGVFGQASFRISDSLSVTVGARYTIDDKKYETTGTVIPINGGTGLPNILVSYPTQNLSESWEKVTPKISVEWEASDDMFFYASANNGFKGGGWQGKPASVSAARTQFEPELAWSYEIGVKSEWFDNRLRANLAGFYVDYEDLQVRQVNGLCVCLVVSNAGDAKIKGIEYEFQAILTDALTLWLSGSFLDTEYVDYIDDLGREFSGNTMQRVPESQFYAGIEYSIPSLGPWDFSMRLDYRWQDDIYWSVNNTTEESAFGLLGGRISYASPDGKYSLSAWGKNLTDEIYRDRASAIFADEYSTMGAPRFYGIEFAFAF